MSEGVYLGGEIPDHLEQHLDCSDVSTEDGPDACLRIDGCDLARRHIGLLSDALADVATRLRHKTDANRSGRTLQASRSPS